MPKVLKGSPCLDSILHSYFTPKKDTKIFLKKVREIKDKNGYVEAREGLTKAGYAAMTKLHELLIAIKNVSQEDFSPDDIIDSLYDVASNNY